MKVRKIARNISRGVGKGALNALKLEAALQTGDVSLGVNSVLGLSEAVMGKRNFVQRGAEKADKRLSKYKAYRLGKQGSNLYHDVTWGDYTGAYKTSIQGAKELAGKRFTKNITAFDRGVQNYAMPTLQRAQDIYDVKNAAQALPSTISKLSSEGGLRNVYSAASKAKTIIGKGGGLAKQL